MFSLYDYYHGLTDIKKRELIKETMSLCNITKNNFRKWVQRNHVPNAHRRTFAREIMQKPDLFDK